MTSEPNDSDLAEEAKKQLDEEIKKQESGETEDAVASGIATKPS